MAEGIEKCRKFSVNNLEYTSSLCPSSLVLQGEEVYILSTYSFVNTNLFKQDFDTVRPYLAYESVPEAWASAYAMYLYGNKGATRTVLSGL